MLQQLYKHGIFYLILFASIVGCNTPVNDNSRVVAEVGHKKLHLSEVSALIPNNTEREDSAVMVDDYIRKWIRQELILQKAEENLPDYEKDVSKELEEYRNSLIIFRYKNKMIGQRMDTTVSNSEIIKFYSDNSKKLKLSSPIVKATYLKIPVDFANPSELKKMAHNTSSEGIEEMRNYCLQYAKAFDIITDTWTNFNRAAKNIPVSIDNPESFLRKNQIIEHKDSSNYYLLVIHDYKLKNEQAPVEYVHDNIKSLILNRRKIQFLRELENNIFIEGENNNNFKIYKLGTHETE